MKATHKYLISPFIYLLVFLASAIPYLLAGYIVDGVFDLLCEELPGVFKSHSFVNAPEAFAAQERTLTIVRLALTCLTVAFVALVADDKRAEHIISLTDGRYTLPQGMKLYYAEFTRVDLLTAILPPILLAVPAALIPEDILIYGFESVLRPILDTIEIFGLFEGVGILAVLSAIARLAIAPFVLSRWRVGWLCGEM